MGQETHTFTKREVMVLECFAKAWVDSDHQLYGCLSYKDALDLLVKLGISAVFDPERITVKEKDSTTPGER